jgi:hypothetical protein
MIPVTQTKVVVKNKNGDIVVDGNCYAAAIASMLELPITEVPNGEVFFNDKEDHMFYETLMKRFLKNRGLELISDYRYAAFHGDNGWWEEDEAVKHREALKGQLYLATGRSPRGFAHIAIYKNGEMVFDPHPSRDGLDTVYQWEIIREIS